MINIEAFKSHQQISIFINNALSREDNNNPLIGITLTH